MSHGEPNDSGSPDNDLEQATRAEAETRTVDVETLRSALAELEDAKQRIQRDAGRQLDLLRAQVLESLLPVLDNLERSMEAARAPECHGVLQGIQLVHSQFLAALTRFGLERVSAVGSRFDPRLHDAVAVVPVGDSSQDGVVVSELEPAYVFGGRVVRPAKVAVGRAADRPLV